MFRTLPYLEVIMTPGDLDQNVLNPVVPVQSTWDPTYPLGEGVEAPLRFQKRLNFLAGQWSDAAAFDFFKPEEVEDSWMMNVNLKLKQLSTF